MLHLRQIKAAQMKFGDIVENTAAGRRNPQRVMMFVSYSGKYLKFMSTAGEELKFYHHDLKQGFLVHTGKRVDFSEWRRLAQEATVEPVTAEKGGA